MVSETRMKLLFDRYVDGSSSAEETRAFFTLFNDPEHSAFFVQLMDEYLVTHQFSDGLTKDQKENILHQVFSAKEPADLSLPIGAKKTVPIWRKLTAAAAVLILISFGVYFIQKYHQTVSYITYKGDLVPGGNKATLTLADGTTLSLTDAANGKLAEQSGVSIRKTADGRVQYEVKGQQPKFASGFNTIATPAGGQYQIVLPDGSRVWLNSASTLKYPVSFAAGAERKVELSGEAYFEIAKTVNGTRRIPFLVTSRGQEVEVLGTHFNINNYNEEEFTATTLLEGSVRVFRSGTFDEIITPGEQARVKKDIKVVQVDTTVAVAWKNGLFKFENASIYMVMNQFSRWYDIDVEYKGKIPSNKFNGEIYRNMNASKAFKILSFANINFRIEAPEHNHGRKKIIIEEN